MEGLQQENNNHRGRIFLHLSKLNFKYTSKKATLSNYSLLFLEPETTNSV